MKKRVDIFVGPDLQSGTLQHADLKSENDIKSGLQILTNVYDDRLPRFINFITLVNLDTMKIKLKFSTSAATALEPHEIITRARLAIADKKYNLESVTDRSVSFKDAPLNFQANLSIRMMDEGQFVISDNHDGRQLLTLYYRYNLLPIILISIFLSIWLKYEGETWAIAAILIFYAIAIPFDIKNFKRKAQDMVSAIAG